MEKQEIKSYPKKRHPVMEWIFYGAAIFIGIAIICGLLFLRNPFMIPTVDASDETVSWLPESRTEICSGQSHGFEVYRVLYGGYQ